MIFGVAALLLLLCSLDYAYDDGMSFNLYYLFVLMDANAQTGGGIAGENEGTMGEYGRNELNENGELLLTFATDNRLAVLNTFFGTRRGRI